MTVILSAAAGMAAYAAVSFICRKMKRRVQVSFPKK